jgi:hypothetical protein
MCIYEHFRRQTQRETEQPITAGYYKRERETRNAAFPSPLGIVDGYLSSTELQGHDRAKICLLRFVVAFRVVLIQSSARRESPKEEEFQEVSGRKKREEKTRTWKKKRKFQLPLPFQNRLSYSRNMREKRSVPGPFLFMPSIIF